MIIGFSLNGKTKQFANQHLITEFFSIGIPLFPVTSYFINEETGLKIKIPLSNESLSTFYLGGTLIWIGTFSFALDFVIAGMLVDKTTIPYFHLAPFFISFVVLLTGLYHYFVKSKSDKKEIKRRTVLQMGTGMNALPNWLGKNEALKIMDSLKTGFDGNWKDIIKNNNYDKKDFYRLFSLVSYEVYLNPTHENTQLMTKMEMVFNK